MATIQWSYTIIGCTIRFLDHKNLCFEQKIITLTSLEPEIWQNMYFQAAILNSKMAAINHSKKLEILFFLFPIEWGLKRCIICRLYKGILRHYIMNLTIIRADCNDIRIGLTITTSPKQWPFWKSRWPTTDQ